MMTEEEMKEKARLIAIEYVLANTLASFYLALGYTEDQINLAHANASWTLNAETIPGADPAQSDMWTAEIEEAVASLLAHAKHSWASRTK